MKTKQIALYAGILLSGLFLGYLFFGADNEPQTIEEHIADTHTDEEGNVVYTCSMHPQIRENEPGDCPICGMELIPVSDSEPSAAAENDYTLSMTNAAMKLADIQTTPVRMGSAVHTFTLPGKVTENQNNVSKVTAHFPGRIRDLYVDYEGAFVRKGQKLASVYSPELIAAQQELLETVKYKDQNPRLYEAARQKLRLWEFPERTINEIEESAEVMTKLDFYSPVNGYVSEVAISREEHVNEGSLMYRVANLSSVWVDFQAYESNIASIKEGDKIRFSVEAYPGEQFESDVIYVDPFLNNDSRSVTIRAKVENVKSQLKPGMLAKANIETKVAEDEVLLVPRSAVMWTGKRSIVYVQVRGADTPVFEAREVVLGQRAGNHYVVESGLNEGELVVSNGTFKIDSAAQLNDKLSMMNREPGSGANRTGHEGHTMEGKPESKASNASVGTTTDGSTGNSQVFQNQLKSVLSGYMSLKDALFDGNIDQVKAEAISIKSNITGVDMNLLKGEKHQRWMDYSNNLNSSLKSLGAANTIEKQRQIFMTLSTELIEAVKFFELSGVWYEQFCPMADGGNGAYWLSTNETISNPYYGDQMHDCGETITKIEF